MCGRAPYFAVPLRAQNTVRLYIHVILNPLFYILVWGVHFKLRGRAAVTGDGDSIVTRPGVVYDGVTTTGKQTLRQFVSSELHFFV